MIRDKNKIYAELVSTEIALVPNDLVQNKYVVSAGNRDIKIFNPGPKRIIITDTDGNASSFSYNQANKLIGIDQNTKLVLFPQITDDPPTGREFVALVSGSLNPSAALVSKAVTLEGPAWYEIQVTGAGGGGGAGIGRYHSPASFLNGTKGGRGGSYIGLIKIYANTIAYIEAGNAGGGGDGIIWQNNIPSGTNLGGAGGRNLIVHSSIGNAGINPIYSPIGDIPETQLGGLGINGGARGGNARATHGNITEEPIIADTRGAGGSGGGANGPFGGIGGDSIYEDNFGILDSCSGGAGGAGGGLGAGGAGGGTAPSKPISYGAGAGGSGVLKNVNDYTYSAGGGGGGGASRFACGDLIIICGGGGGGAGAGFGGWKLSTEGGHGTNNINNTIGNGAMGGEGGLGYNRNDNKSFHNCKGEHGYGGMVRIWRCV